LRYWTTSTAISTSLGQDRGVTDTHDRRRIEEHEVVAALGFGDEFLHGRRIEDTDGAAGQTTGWQEVKRRNLRGLDDFFEAVLLQKIIGQPQVVGHVEDLVQAGTTEVRVHDQHSIAILGEHRRQVEDRRGFAFASAT